MMCKIIYIKYIKELDKKHNPALTALSLLT